jgi:hypothetical protein
MSKFLKIIPNLLLSCLFFSAAALASEAKIPVTYENYNQTETARNFNNWAKLGG